jgi:subtilisin family serine protease
MNKSSQLLTAAPPLARVWLASSLLFVTALAQGQALPPVETTPDGHRYRAGEVLVQFKADVTDQQVTGAFQHGRLGLIKHIQTPTMKAHGRIGITRTATVLSVPEAVRRLNQLPGVEFAEPDWVATQNYESNDPLYLSGSLWGMFSDDSPGVIGPAATYNLFGTQAEKAWAAGFVGSPDSYVGVIDGGLQLNHPDLAANIWTNPGEIAGNGLDDDGDGYVDDLHGWNASDDNGNVSYIDPSTDFHGTHVAGTIGAVGGNGIGVAGVNWNVTLVSGKMFPGGFYSDAIQAIDYMTNLKIRKGLNIVALNHSWGGPSFSQALLDAFTRAAKAGILSVAAAGNNTNNIDITPFYPASFNTTASAGYDSVISVAAITRDGAPASFSNYGQTSVDLAAPGVGVLSTVPFATPKVLVDGQSYRAGQVTYAAGGTVSSELVDGGKALAGDAGWAGKVVLVERGDVTFFTKVMNVQNAGGVAAVIYNNVVGDFSGSLGVGNSSLIPAVCIPREDGLALLAKLGLSATVESPLPGTPGSDYAAYDGTSMAAPHVTGAVALYASVHPGSTPAQTRHDLLTVGVRPLAALQGVTVTGGTLDIGTLMTVPANTLAAPAAATTLKATAASGTRVDLSWTDRSNNELGFDLERSTDGVTYYLADTVGSAHVSYSDLTVQPGHTYFYRVRAYNPGGSSAYAPPTSVATPAVTLPKAPSSLTATALTAGSGVSLAWKDNATNEAGFQIERLTGSNWQVLTTVAANTTTFKDASAARRTTYTYRVLAFNVAGGSPYSNQASVTTK